MQRGPKLMLVVIGIVVSSATVAWASWNGTVGPEFGEEVSERRHHRDGHGDGLRAGP